jgi:ERF superfamily protein
MTHDNLAAALAAFHAEAPKVVKDATAKVTGESKTGQKISYSYEYADLATITEALNPLLGKHGLAFIAMPTLTAQGFGLVYELRHESNDDGAEGFWPLPDPTRIKPQELGSFITYWRRYAFLAITNTFPSGEDDDGATAQTARPALSQEDFDKLPTQRPQQAPAEAKPKRNWAEATDAEVGGFHQKIESADVVDAVKLYDWMASHKLHSRTLHLPNPLEGGEPLAVTATEILAYRMADIAVKPETTLGQIANIKAYAENRGLLKVQVSESTTLDEELAMARDTKALIEPTPGAAGSEND